MMKLTLKVSAIAWLVLSAACSENGKSQSDMSEDGGAPPEDGGGRPAVDAGCWSLPSVARVRFFPRRGHAAAMTGGTIVGSNDSATNGFVVLATIGAAPPEGAWTEIAIANPKPYRYVKYYGPAGSHGDVAEVAFFDAGGALDGAPFGTVATDAAGAYAHAFDGDVETYFDGLVANDQYVGLDLGAKHETAAPVLTPGSGRFAAATTVTLTSPSAGATIKYTLDGSDPHAGKPYAGPFTVTSTAVVRAVATQACALDSPVASALYAIGAPSKSAQSVMYVGNSLTGSVWDVVPMLATSGRLALAPTECLSPGAGTKDLWDATSCSYGVTDVKATLASTPFDNVTLQPFAASLCTPSIDGGDADYVNRFYKLAIATNPDVQGWIYAQWPQPVASDWSQADCFSDGAAWATPRWVPPNKATDWESALANHIAYHETVRDAVERANAGTPAKRPLIIPGGLALKNLKHAIENGQVPGTATSAFFSVAFGQNGTDLHLAPAGRYMVGLVFFACFFKKSPEGLGVADSGLTAEQAAVYQRIAWQTALDYPFSGLR